IENATAYLFSRPTHRLPDGYIPTSIEEAQPGSVYFPRDGTIKRRNVEGVDNEVTTLLFDPKNYTDPDSVFTPNGTPFWPSPTTPILLPAYMPQHLVLKAPQAFIMLEESDDEQSIMSSNATLRSTDFKRYFEQFHAGIRKYREEAMNTMRKEQQKMAEGSQDRDRQTHEFEPGDLVWLSASLKMATEKNNLKPTAKLTFRWIGPLRVLAKLGDTYTLVHTFPGEALCFRTANAARMRPYTVRVPVDRAVDAAKDAKDDYLEEIERWQRSRVFLKRPSVIAKVSDGVNPEWLRRQTDLNLQGEA
ncbi:hypothetical protein HDU76_011310, partial [Blyttiomyces sp. JEL0837]